MATIPIQERRPLVRPAGRSGSGRPRRSYDSAVIAAPAALAAILSFYGITGRSLGFDEGATVAIASQHGSTLWAGIAHDGGNMSGFYLALHVLIGLFGNGLLVLRFVSALAITATAGLIAAIGRRLFDRVVGLAAGALTAVSLPLIYWGQTARGYAPMVAFVCAAYLAFIALADPRRGSTGRGAWIGYVAAMVLAMYCSFVAVLVVPAQLLVLGGRRGAWRRVTTALGAVALLSVPLAVLAARRGSGQLFWVTRPNRMVDTQVLQSLTSAGLSPSFHPTATTYLLMWATVAAVGALVVELAWRWFRPDAWGRALTLAWCVVPAGLTFLSSLVLQPTFVPRNVLLSTPAVALALATLLTHRAVRRGVPVAVAVIAVLALRALQVAPSYGVSPEPWSTVTHRVLAAARPGDCVAFYPEDGRNAFQYYLGTGADRAAPRSILPVLPWGTVKPYVERYATLSPAQLASRAAGCRRVWYVSSHEGQPNGPVQARANRRRYFQLQAELVRRYGFARVDSYGYASTIHVQLFSR